MCSSFLGMGWDWVHLVFWPLFGLLYQPRMMDVRWWWWWVWSSWWNENWQGKMKYLEKSCPSATSSTKNPTWPNLGCLSGNPVTNLLSYDMVLMYNKSDHQSKTCLSSLDHMAIHSNISEPISVSIPLVLEWDFRYSLVICSFIFISDCVAEEVMVTHLQIGHTGFMHGNLLRSVTTVMSPSFRNVVFMMKNEKHAILFARCTAS
jgi:hypothetical protein